MSILKLGMGVIELPQTVGALLPSIEEICSKFITQKISTVIIDHCHIRKHEKINKTTQKCRFNTEQTYTLILQLIKQVRD